MPSAPADYPWPSPYAHFTVSTDETIESDDKLYYDQHSGRAQQPPGDLERLHQPGPGAPAPVHESRAGHDPAALIETPRIVELHADEAGVRICRADRRPEPRARRPPGRQHLGLDALLPQPALDHGGEVHDVREAVHAHQLAHRDAPGRRDTERALQRKLYEGFFQAWHGNPSLGGFMMWEWPPGEGGAKDKGYTPENKPAEKVRGRVYRIAPKGVRDEVPKVDVSVSATFRSDQGQLLEANRGFATEEIAPSLGMLSLLAAVMFSLSMRQYAKRAA